MKVAPASADSHTVRKGHYPIHTASAAQKALAWIWVTVWCALHYVSPFLLISALWPIYEFSSGTVTWSCVVLALAFYPHKPWPAARQLFRSWFEIFDLTYVVEGEQKKGEKFVACWSPHGIVPVTSYMGFSFMDIHFHEHYGSSAVASVLFYLPILRTVLIWCGAVGSSASTLRKVLDTGNLSILPGGLAELFLSSREKETLYMKNRKGIVHIAIQKKAKIVPIYTFGNTQYFNQLATYDGIFSKFSRKLQASFTFFWGQYFLPIPYPTKSVIVIGKAVELPPGDSPEDLEDMHKRWMETIEELYEKYKHLAGYPPEKKLQIV